MRESSGSVAPLRVCSGGGGGGLSGTFSNSPVPWPRCPWSTNVGEGKYDGRNSDVTDSVIDGEAVKVEGGGTLRR